MGQGHQLFGRPGLAAGFLGDAILEQRAARRGDVVLRAKIVEQARGGIQVCVVRRQGGAGFAGELAKLPLLFEELEIGGTHLVRPERLKGGIVDRECGVRRAAVHF